MPTIPRPTLADVADAAGVSVTTVSYVVNGKGSIPPETRDRVRKEMARLGYLRRSPVTGRVAMVTSSTGLSPYIHPVMAEHGLSCIEFHLPQDCTEIPPGLVKGCGGIIVDGGLWRREFLEALAMAKPTVFTGSFVPTVKSDAVWVDNASGIYLSVERLLRMGHRRILLLNGPGQTVTSSEKLIGFQRALRHYGEGALGIVKESPNFWYRDSFDTTRSTLLGDPDITAIIAVETEMGIAALDACRELGRPCPDDVSIIVFRDADHLAGSDPPLSAIRLPSEGIIREAVGCLQRRMGNPGMPGKRILLQPDYVERGSVGMAPRALP